MSRFDEKFIPDNPKVARAGEADVLEMLSIAAPGSEEFILHNSGLSFNQGLYRIHEMDQMEMWTENVVIAFPGLSGKIICFGYDWLGRHFAVDRGRIQRYPCRILMLDPETGEALENPVSFQEFHQKELVDCTNDTLAEKLHALWLESGGGVPAMSECVGFRLPLCLGGQDTVQNLELTDMDVYWYLCAQIVAQTRDLPAGTIIRRITITD
jgi:hypothetical protein